MKKIVTLVGARPQFIKAAVVSRAFESYNSAGNGPAGRFEEIIVHSGQHYDVSMSDIFFRELDIPTPYRRLSVNRLSHGAMTGKMMVEVESLLDQIRPDAVLVYGDTNTTLAGALVASKMEIPVVHVESGLRSYNKRMPEELNRVMVDHISSVLFCPTERAIRNLGSEGIFASERLGKYAYGDPPIVVNSGDVMYDAALYYSKKDTPPVAPRGEGREEVPYALCTLHRQENRTKVRLRSILKGLADLSVRFDIVLTLHPGTRHFMEQEGISFKGDNVFVIDPVGYLDMVQLLRQSSLVVTDSGGLQKEAYYFKKPCITTRDETEWLELVENGVNILSGADAGKMVAAADALCSRELDFGRQLYGSGDAGVRIVETLARALG